MNNSLKNTLLELRRRLIKSYRRLEKIASEGDSGRNQRKRLQLQKRIQTILGRMRALGLLHGAAAVLVLGSVDSGLPLLAQTPTIASVSPVANAFDVATSSNINVTFSTSMNLTTISASNIRIFGSQTGLLSTTGQFTGNPARIFTPAAAFKPGERIWVTVKDDAESAGGTALDDPLVFDFMVEAQRGSGTFNADQLNMGARGTSPAIGDLNGDGLLDVIVANLNDNPYRIALNNGDGTFSTSNFGGNFTTEVVLGDLDGDGDLDALGSTSDGKLCDILLNNGDGSFTRQKFGLNRNHLGVALGDLDGDGDLDAIIGSTAGLFRWLNNGNGTFTSTNLNGTAYAHRPEIGDLDGDGDLDVIVPSSRNPSDILINNGDGTFASSTFDDSGSTALTLGDLDGDGDLDAVIAKNNDQHILWTNNGDATFTTSQIGGSTYNTNDITCGDLDGDGDLDIVAANYSGEPHEILLNNGDATFTASTTGARNSTGVGLGDLDNDGDLDILITNRSGQPMDILYNRASAPQITALEPSVTSANLSATTIGISGAEFENVTSVQLSQLNGAGVTVGNIELTYSTQSLIRLNAQAPAGAFATGGNLTLTVFSETGSTSSTILVKDLPTIDAVVAAPQTDEDNSTTLSFQLTADGTDVGDLVVRPPAADLSTIASISQQGATGATTSFLVTPVTNASGSVPLTFEVSDGSLTSSTTIVLTVNPVNDPPVIATSTPNVFSDEDNSTQTSVQLSDIDTPFTNLVLSATSSNLSLVTNGGISFGATGATTSLLFDPVTNANGLAVITVTIDDGEFERSTQINYTVNPVNDPPAISTTTPNISSDEDNATQAVLQLSDVDTAFTNLVLSATSSNQSLVTVNGISFGATGANTTLFLDPVTNANGSAVITVTVDDGEFERSTQISYTVNPVNDPPEISTTTPNISSSEDNSTSTTIQLNDIDTPLTNLLLSATSSNLSLVTNGGISFGATGATTSLQLDPVADANGLAVITVTIDDGEFERSTQINYTVNPVNDPPTIAATAASVSSSEDNSTSTTIQLNDIDTPLTNLLLSATSSNQSLVTSGGISFGATGATTSVQLDPVADANGVAVITVTVDDGEYERSTQITYTVAAVNDPPTIAATAASVSSDEDAATSTTIQLNDIDTPLTNLLLSATSSNLSLVTNGGISFGATGATTSLLLNPVADANGLAVITVTVDDGEFERSTQVNYTVSPVNDPPTIAATAASVSSSEDNSTSTTIQLNDIDTPLTNLLLSATSSNLSLVTSGGISFGATGATTSLQLDPVANANGVAVITVTVDDGEYERSTQISYTVNPVNDPPTIAATAASVSSDEDTATSTTIQLNDIDTPLTNLLLSATSSNLSLVTNGGIQFGATGATTSLLLNPVADANGLAVITVTIDDGEFERSTHISYTVNPVNDPPTIAATAASVSSSEGNSTSTTIQLNDIDTPLTNLLLSATSSNLSLVTSGGISFGATGATTSLQLDPVANANGLVVITVTVDDGEYERSTQISYTVNPVNDPPTITATAASVSSSEDTATSTTIQLNDIDTPLTNLLLSATSSNLSLVTNGGIQFGATGATTSLLLNPVADANGLAIITVTVDDGEFERSTQINYTVAAVNDPPLIAVINASLTGSASQVTSNTVALSDVDTPFAQLILSATSSNQSLFKNQNLQFGVTAASVNLTLTPECGASGSAEIVVSVFDGEYHRATRFDVTVNPTASLNITGATCACPGVRQVYRALPADDLAQHSWTVIGGQISSGQGTGEIEILWDSGASSATVLLNRSFSSGCTSSTQLAVGAKQIQALPDFMFVNSTGGQVDVLQNDLGNNLTITAVSGPVGSSTSVSGANLSFTPAAGFSGVAYLEYTLQIPEGCQTSGTVVAVVGAAQLQQINADFIEREKDRSAGVRGLRGAASVVVSSDGEFVYVAGRNDHSIAIFERDSQSGEVVYDTRVRHGSAGVTGLKYVNDLAISPDGTRLYAAGTGQDALVVFKRNPQTGSLTFLQRKRRGDSDGSATISGMKSPRSVVVSADGKSVIVSGYSDNSLAVFRFDPATGGVRFVESHKDGVNGVNGINRPLGLAFSLDSRHLYVAGSGDDAIAVFAHDAADSELQFVEFKSDNSGGIDGLAIVNSVAVSPDGKHVYACGTGDDAVAVFSRNLVSGALTFVQQRRTGTGGISGMRDPQDLTLSPNGAHLWVAGTGDNALVQFERNPENGELEFVAAAFDNVGGFDGLAGVKKVHVSPNSQHVYAAGSKENSLAALLLNRAPEAKDDNVGLLSSQSQISITPLLNDTDAEFQILTISSVGPPALGSVTIGSGGTSIEYSTGATIGSDSFSYTISDGAGGSSTATVYVNLLAPKAGVSPDIEGDRAEMLLKPNPATDRVEVGFVLERTAELELRISDLLGNQFVQFELGERRFGRQSVGLDLRDASGQPLPNGAYLIEVLSGEKAEFVKTLIIRR